MIIQPVSFSTKPLQRLYTDATYVRIPLLLLSNNIFKQLIREIRDRLNDFTSYFIVGSREAQEFQTDRNMHLLSI